MKVAIASVQVPFTRGGAESHAESLREALRERGYEADIVTIPFKWYPPSTLIGCMIAARMTDLTEVDGERIDLVIALKFPAYYLKHPNKVVWLLHQHRQAYDLWETEFGDLHNLPEGKMVRETIVANDRDFLSESRTIYTNSRLVSDRLRLYNGLDSTPLYHPPPNHQQLHCSSYEPFIFYPSRIDPMKRQRVLVEAAALLNSSMQVVIAGRGSAREMDALARLISERGLAGRVHLLGEISEPEKIDYYARCSAVYFGAFQEDYGYVPLEAFLSHKPVIAFENGGEALQFIRDGENGFVVKDNPASVACAIERLATESGLAQWLGERAFRTMRTLDINWDHVVACLTGSADG